MYRSAMSLALSRRGNWQSPASKHGDRAHDTFQSICEAYLDAEYPGEFIVESDEGHHYAGTKKNRFVLDVRITSVRTGLPMFFEVKRQGAAGNSHERSFKYHPGTGHSLELQERFSTPYKPVVCVYAGDMVNPNLPASTKYRAELALSFREYPDHYLEWHDEAPNTVVDYLESFVLPRIAEQRVQCAGN